MPRRLPDVLLISFRLTLHANTECWWGARVSNGFPKMAYRFLFQECWTSTVREEGCSLATTFFLKKNRGRRLIPVSRFWVIIQEARTCFLIHITRPVWETSALILWTLVLIGCKIAPNKHPTWVAQSLELSNLTERSCYKSEIENLVSKDLLKDQSCLFVLTRS